MKFVPIYSNFDGLDVSFQGAFPSSVLNALDLAKTKAQTQRNSMLAEIGTPSFTVLVGESGARGGYSYRFDTGLDGATWFVANSEDKTRWNIRFSAKSLNLALNGYWGVKRQIETLFNQVAAYGPESLPLERISRFDFCVDFLVKNFQPEPTNFIAHSRSARHIYTSPMETVRRGQLIESIRIGEMPGRQVVIYNKSKEIKVHNKQYWKQIWGIDSQDSGYEVWRIEIRAGKAELDKHNIRSFTDMENNAQRVIKNIAHSIRYTLPNNNRNPSRWPLHPLWESVHTAIEKNLVDYIPKGSGQAVKAEMNGNLGQMLCKQINGVATTYALALGLELENMEDVSEIIFQNLQGEFKENPGRVKERFERAKRRYGLVENPDTVRTQEKSPETEP